MKKSKPLTPREERWMAKHYGVTVEKLRKLMHPDFPTLDISRHTSEINPSEIYADRSVPSDEEEKA